MIQRVTKKENILFKMIETKLDGLSLLAVEHPSGVALKVFPELGARLHELTFVKDNQPIEMLMPLPLNEDPIENPHFFHSPLIPFPNRLRDGAFEHEGTSYKFPINSPSDHTSLHGMVFNKSFQVIDVECGAEEASCMLQYNYDGADSSYPWPFTVQIIYTINSSNEILCKTTIQNTGLKSQPMGMGWHHYLSFPQGMADIELKLPSSSRVLVGGSMIPTGKKVAETGYDDFKTLDNTKFDTCFKLDHWEDENTIQVLDRVRELQITVLLNGKKSGFKYFQLFNHPQGTGFAIEPMTCNIDALNNGEGMVLLYAGEILDTCFQIKMNDLGDSTS